jgi:hypothetical protein
MFGMGRDYPRNSAPAYDTPGGIAPMISKKGLSAIPNSARNSGDDIDRTPIPYAYPINGSDVLELQLLNGLSDGAFQGKTSIPGIPPGWLAFNALSSGVFRPATRISQQYGGFMPNPVSPYQIQNMIASTAGSEPVNPGGPGQSLGAIPMFEGW